MWTSLISSGSTALSLVLENLTYGTTYFYNVPAASDVSDLYWAGTGLELGTGTGGLATLVLIV